MQRYQLVIKIGTESTISYVDANKVLDLLNAYGISAGHLDDGAADGEGRSATWVTVEGKIITCPCRCNNLVKAEGKFRPGHDARLVGNLLRQVRTEQITRQAAMNTLVRWPNLQAKLARYLDK